MHHSGNQPSVAECTGDGTCRRHTRHPIISALSALLSIGLPISRIDSTPDCAYVAGASAQANWLLPVGSTLQQNLHVIHRLLRLVVKQSQRPTPDCAYVAGASAQANWLLPVGSTLQQNLHVIHRLLRLVVKQSYRPTPAGR